VDRAAALGVFALLGVAALAWSRNAAAAPVMDSGVYIPPADYTPPADYYPADPWIEFSPPANAQAGAGATQSAGWTEYPWEAPAPAEAILTSPAEPPGESSGPELATTPEAWPPVDLDAVQAASGPGIIDAARALLASTGNFEPMRSPNVLAFLAMIRQIEGGAQGYNALFGGGRFESFADHPRTVVEIWGRDNAGNPKLYRSSAAGAYQIMRATWDDIRGRIGATDFSPEAQDAAAVALIKRRGALADVAAGRFNEAVAKVRKEWASLPGAGYNQPEQPLARVRNIYLAAGGEIASV
jgi:lysozyme